MTLTPEDCQALYSMWMAQKVRMHLTQMEMAKRLRLSQVEFSHILRGQTPLTMQFVTAFCSHLNVDPYTFLPTLINLRHKERVPIRLVNRVIIDGDIEAVHVEGNQVIIEYSHIVPMH